MGADGMPVILTQVSIPWCEGVRKRGVHPHPHLSPSKVEGDSRKPG